MKLLTLAALAATLLCAETSQTGEITSPVISDIQNQQRDHSKDGPPAGGQLSDSDALTPEQVAMWRLLNSQIEQANQALAEKEQAKDKAIVAYYAAREAAQKAYNDGGATWLKLVADAKRDGYNVDPKTMRWVKLPTPVAQGK